jgi:hypothetical protein
LARRFLIGLVALGAAIFMASSAIGQTNEARKIEPEIEAVVERSSISDAEFDKAFRRLKSQDQLQFEMANALPPPKMDWLKKLLKPFFEFLGAMLPVFKILFWALLAFGAGLILYIIAMALWNFRQARKNREDDDNQPSPLYRPSSERARILLAAVDELAEQGLYAEAVHQLLFRSVQDLTLARPNMIRRSYTSREIAGLHELTPETRTAFSFIAAEVERSYFGGRSLDKQAFLRCREAYAQLAVQDSKSEAPFLAEGARA